jgi:hypothetical protein
MEPADPAGLLLWEVPVRLAMTGQDSQWQNLQRAAAALQQQLHREVAGAPAIRLKWPRNSQCAGPARRLQTDAPWPDDARIGAWAGQTTCRLRAPNRLV